MTRPRLGVDEFVVVLDGVEDPSEAVRVTERLLGSLDAPVAVAGQLLRVGASIEIVVSSAGVGATDLLRAADGAMYRAKRRRRGGARYELHDADLATEAQHPQRGLLLPAEFIGLAEETGVIVPLGRLGPGRLQHPAPEGHDRYPNDPPLAVCVNVSAREFEQPDWVEQVGNVPRATGLDPRSAQLELTESVLAEDLGTVAAILRQLERLGVQLSIEDIGMGYSGLNALRHLPLNILKLDKLTPSAIRVAAVEHSGRARDASR